MAEPATVIHALNLPSSEFGRILRLRDDTGRFPIPEVPCWQSNGGSRRGHPSRSLPFAMDVELPNEVTRPVRIHLVGVFALHAGKAEEAPGTLGATVHLLRQGEIVFRHDLTNGRHYREATDLSARAEELGDGTSILTQGVTSFGEDLVRVDLMCIDIPDGLVADTLSLKDLGSPASFVIASIFCEVIPPSGCPFSAHGGSVPLSELGSILRVGDRVRFSRAVTTLRDSLLRTEDLDEARGQALTFLAIVTAATLERGGDRSLHREQLEAAREFEQVASVEGLATIALRRVDELTSKVFFDRNSLNRQIVDRALALIERNFGKPISDAAIAVQLGLSTSHFRFLFREETGQPFHKYLVSLRLEKARKMLMDGELPVSEVARAVGFSGTSHFSRAFTQRFDICPSSVRRGSG